MAMTAWDHLGEIANVAQLTGFDAVRLIGMIVNAATTARLHKKNCRQFAMHLRLIGNLLEQLQISELKKYKETREPLEQLEDALRRSFVLVNSCQDRSYLYLLAMGWTLVYQFKKAQDEIDRYLKIIPLISLVDNSRVKERLEYIETDRHEYTLDDEDLKVQEVIMNPDPSNTYAAVLRNSFSYSYPDMPFNEVIKIENEKLHSEIQHSQSYLDVDQCELIQNLMDITEVFASNPQFENVVPYHSYDSSNQEHENNNDLQIVAYSAPRSTSTSEVFASNPQFEYTVPYYSYDSSNQKLETNNNLQIVAYSAPRSTSTSEVFASNPQFEYAVPYYSYDSSNQELENNDLQIVVYSAPRSISATSRQDLLPSRRPYQREEWHFGLKTFFFPCGTLSKIATIATNMETTSVDVCNEIMAYSLIVSCCCYTCCIRRKLRNKLNIRGGCCGDFLLHLCCSCCALVQELREIETRRIHGIQKTQTRPPSQQYMES
uniref:protein MID1-COMPLEMENTING ACTIVITY 1-like isoform X2 n=1 Tax=Erigeron canadensis TaxID=72917 RepID=UPI001CB89C13|nr:protein MID1-COMPLEMENTING ACTIVITY 1-like isoform X2 [Erigeron canadensis]